MPRPWRSLGPSRCLTGAELEVVRELSFVASAGSPKADTPRNAVTFGNFDGVHVGHRAMLKAARQAASQLGGESVVVTFDPHPLSLLDPTKVPGAIDSVAARLELLASQKVDRVILLSFDSFLKEQSAEWFARTVLLGEAAAGVVIAGYDSRFGRRGEGDTQLLAQLAEEGGATIEVTPPVLVDGAIVSSSRVRKFVTDGDVASAARLLTRPFCLRGPVVHGDAVGRTIGFPTANLDAHEQLRPAAGVYAGWLTVGGERAAAVCNAGVRPTVSAGKQWRLEAHALDTAGDWYGEAAALELVERIRPEQRFSGLEALKQQIARDCESARQILSQSIPGN